MALGGDLGPAFQMTPENGQPLCSPLLRVLSQMLLSSTADRGWSRLGHLSQPWIFHGGNQGRLSLNNCSLPAQMQMCSQQRGFNLWRGKEGKDRGSQSSCSLFTCSVLSLSSLKGLEEICLFSEGTGLRHLGFFLRGGAMIGQGLQMGCGPPKTGLRVSLWGWRRGIKSCENSLLLFPSPP